MPTWAVCAIVNGDYSGLTSDDEADLDAFLEREHYVRHFDIVDDEPSFTSSPEFGLACDCVLVRGYFLPGADS